jgi:hypothetical protein
VNGGALPDNRINNVVGKAELSEHVTNRINKYNVKLTTLCRDCGIEFIF